MYILLKAKYTDEQSQRLNLIFYLFNEDYIHLETTSSSPTKRLRF